MEGRFPNLQNNRYPEENYNVYGHGYGGETWKARKRWIDTTFASSAKFVDTRICSCLLNSIRSASDLNTYKPLEQIESIEISTLSSWNIDQLMVSHMIN